MSEITQSVHKAGKVLECLFEDDFKGKTIKEIWDLTGVDPQSARRSLLTWEALGWVVETPVSGGKASRWIVAEKLANISASYRRTALEQIHLIEENYKRITGEELRA
ncbi:hypothetical protein [Sedimenticola selenatireducens]|uniref:hypothetical protein n=1 Tax=Sedimenticola selenatireducens TaxID=191960 RepID=UPI00049189F4|nr:hypothetical protein [Sedimenticola selenatireducens]